MAIARALERCEVPAGGVPHDAHLRVGWVYLREAPTVEAARQRMATTLRTLAASVGQENKYSEPVTAFWMYQLAAVRALLGDVPCDEALRAFPRLRDKSLIERAR